TPPKRQLISDEKEANRLISQVRVRVEHAIGGVKVFHIARDAYRNRRANFVDMLFETAFRRDGPRIDAQVLISSVSAGRMGRALLAVALAHNMAIQALKHLKRERIAIFFLSRRKKRSFGVLASQPVHDRFDICSSLIRTCIHYPGSSDHM